MNPFELVQKWRFKFILIRFREENYDLVFLTKSKFETVLF